MRARQEPPSMLELCETFRKRKEFMWNLNRSGSQLEESPPAYSSRQTALTSVNEEQTATELTETGRDLPLRSKQTRRPTRAYESRISYSRTEEDEKFCNAEQKSDPQTEFFKSDDVASASAVGEYYAFEDDGARTVPLQKQQQVYRRKRSNAQAAELYRSPCDEMSPPQRDEKRMPRKGMPRDGKDTPGSWSYGKTSYPLKNTQRCSHYPASYPDSNTRRCSHYRASNPPHNPQANTRDPCAHYQASNLPHNEANSRDACSHYQASYPHNQPNTRDACSHYQVQDRSEKRTSRRSSVYMQQDMPRNETGSAQKRPDHSNRATTRFPAMQQCTTAHSCQLQGTEEHRSRCRRQEVCEVRNPEYSRHRRIGVCLQTDSTREHRKFVRILAKRF
ncbi:hypothetical protein OS493_034378 [Desmophyllum pertusum]|uniref:Uncharacterized protein n=1 Tax=Desmophyllum pertusum TaxID=174260 RepID=A0A9W9ZZQ5_9CNID|nr:hypothetical protein OS493_034378 [Desmophyllum pertusum]